MAAADFDAVVVGAGFAGLYMLHRLRQAGFSARVYEAGGGVGGTWYWNRYPGARCDAESVEYSYQFSEALQQEWNWSERYATQSEILRYANHVADRFDLRRDIRFDTRVNMAHFDEASGRWRVHISDGAPVSARFCIMATGCLSSPNVPDIPGLDGFGGPWYHTGNWPREPVDFTGLRVGVIGTGSTGIQLIPVLAREAEHLFVFQRTPNYTVPARNAPLSPGDRDAVKADYRAFRERISRMAFGTNLNHNEARAAECDPDAREREYASRWRHGGLPFLAAFADLLLSEAANDTAAEFIRARIREIVRDPATAERLSPRSILGCKRLCLDTDYYETFNRANVSLIDLREDPIEAITREGLRTRAASYALEALVFATGFDAMTGALNRIDIRGRGGRALKDKWAGGPRAYLGLGVAGFPNLFTVTGPGSPSVLSNMIPSIEQHVNWIGDCLEYLRREGCDLIEATVEAEDAWVAHVNELAERTLFTRCNSWYIGANIPGKPRVFMPYIGVPPYVQKCNEIAAAGYEGFVLGATGQD
jgi:cyclohexanone monooxygenase